MPELASPTNPVRHPIFSFANGEMGPVASGFIRAMEKVTGQPKIKKLYFDYVDDERPSELFWTDALERLNISYNLHNEATAQIPRTGRLLIVANHPFGVIDGLIMCNMALDYANDFQVVINSLLCQDRDLVPHFLPIDFTETKEATKRNVRSKQLAGKALADGVPLILFPSGHVSTADAPGFGDVVDHQWTTFIAKLVMQYQPTVVPVYFHGQNTRLFHVASNIAEPFRMAMHMREALKRFGSTVSLDVGAHHSPEDYAHIRSRQEMTQHFYDIVQSTRRPRSDENK